MINPNNIVDNMKPFEYRFNKNKEFIEDVLPFTKYNEQYIIVRQYGKNHGYIYDIEDDISPTLHYHYYIINNDSQVVGRFDVCGRIENCGFTYHIIEEFQNRGIGQTALSFIVDKIFKQGVNRIVILAVNERSAAIALKIGFSQKSKRVFEMWQLDYQHLNESHKTI
jgi:RimJ/RimL family protein N-acetyltransferase